MSNKNTRRNREALLKQLRAIREIVANEISVYACRGMYCKECVFSDIDCTAADQGLATLIYALQGEKDES